MANKQHQVGKTITTKSPYGSHASMIVDPNTYSNKIGENEVVCKDGNFTYITQKWRIDNGLADPNRYSGRKTELIIDNLE